MDLVRDPVCGATIDRTTLFRQRLGGTQYYFCSCTCLWAFRKDPNPRRAAGWSMDDWPRFRE